MSKGLSETQVAIMGHVKEKGAINIIEACAVYNYVRAKKKNPAIHPNNIWLWPSEPGEITGTQRGAQSVYRMMRSLENRGLVARLLHRRLAVWYYITEWTDEKSIKLSHESPYDENVVADRDGKVAFRAKGMTFVRHYPEPTYSQLRHQDRQKQWKEEKNASIIFRAPKRLKDKWKPTPS